MNRIIKTQAAGIGLVLAGLFFLVGCDQDRSADAEEPVLRVHAVDGLNVERLDEKLNELLAREDLPLRGRVELLDDERLAVNASRYLQDEIAAMIEQLRDTGIGEAIQRPFRVEFWLLKMAPGEGSGDLPDSLREDLSPLLAEYEGYELSVDDYLESFHSGLASIDRITSGKRTYIWFNKVAADEQRIHLTAQVDARVGAPDQITYQVNHSFAPGQALVLGRAHNGGDGARASYQVLVARAEWTDSAN